MAEIVLINPRFDVSFWGLERALPLVGKRANLPVACLPLLAALTPAEHRVTLIDENIEPIDFDRVARADIVGLTGMIVQRFQMRRILEQLKARGAFTVVGGPWITVAEDYFGDLADVVFVGEADETWPRFLEEWRNGRHEPRYEQAEKTDMTRLPVPRYDLLKMRHYLFGSVQFSRGCPFLCEFCDIIVTFGRRPRLKTSEQIIADLEALCAQKMEIVFIVDDNLIGNKKAIKPVLEEVVRWQKERGYPLTFFTEASIDLAEDAELMELMVEANVQAVFIGIESPNEASLRETKKLQNVRPAGTLVERVRRVQQAGLDVWCGMIVGFDHDDASIFAAQREFLSDARLLHAMIGMLYAIPKTPLHDRLAAEGRLDLDDDDSEFGTNVIPLLMTREELRDGYARLMQEVYDPEAYFERLDDLFLRDRLQFGAGRTRYWAGHFWRQLMGQARQATASVYIYWKLMRGVPDPALRREYRRHILGLLKARPDPAVLFVYLVKCAVHYHHYTMSAEMTREEKQVVNTF
jgi:radical SAM superfamily enzyme YgiQ (UPF0313 family)